MLDVTADTFDTEVVGSDVPVLVDFWSPTCVPCKALAPQVEKFAAAYAGRLKVVKVNTLDQRELALSLGVTSMPTFHLYVSGAVVERKSSGQGGIPALRAMVDPHLA